MDDPSPYSRIQQTIKDMARLLLAAFLGLLIVLLIMALGGCQSLLRDTEDDTLERSDYYWPHDIREQIDRDRRDYHRDVDFRSHTLSRHGK